MPTAPTAGRPSVAAPTYPPVSGPGRIFQFAEAPVAPAPWTQQSRYVLYDDGTFALQYAGHMEYRGTYTGDNGVVTFVWEGWSVAGPWGATGSIAGESLTVRYNLVMQMSDFEDAVYVRMR